MGDDRTRIASRIDDPDRARGAKLVLDERARRPFPADVRDRETRNCDRVAGLANALADRIVVMQTIGERPKAADGFERSPAQGDRRAEAGARRSEAERHDDARKEIRIDAERGQRRPEAGPADAVVETGHRADAGSLEFAREVRKMVRADQNVAVDDRQEFRLRQRRHVHEIGDLAVAAVLPGVDLQIDPDLGSLGGDGFDDADRRVGGVAHAADELDRRAVSLPAQGQEPFAKLRVFAAKRNENRRRRAAGRSAASLRLETA